MIQLIYGVEWNQNKAISNRLKHGVTFEEAKTVFNDPFYIDFYDPDHSSDEERYIIIGELQLRRLLLVSYTERENIIRLISARKATARERKVYEKS